MMRLPLQLGAVCVILAFAVTTVAAQDPAAPGLAANQAEAGRPAESAIVLERSEAVRIAEFEEQKRQAKFLLDLYLPETKADDGNIEIEDDVPKPPDDSDAWMEVDNHYFYRFFFFEDGSFRKYLDLLESNLETYLKSTQSRYGLSETEMAKVRVAARGDLKNFIDDFNNAHKQAEQTKNNRDDLITLFAGFSSLRDYARTGPFGAKSKYRKSVERFRRIHAESESIREALRQAF